MSEITPRLSFPYILQSQSQKETTHNESLIFLDAFVQTAVESAALTAPPTTLTSGALYIVADSATGDWEGYDGDLAQYIGSTWVFYIPFAGMRVWDKATPQGLIYNSSGAWENDLTAAAKVGFFGSTPITQPTVSGSKSSNAALTSLITKLALLGLIVDSTT